MQERSAYGVAFRDIGSLLSGDYNPKDTTTREEVKQMHLDTIRKAKDAGQHVMVKKGFDYVLPYVDLITDVDLAGTSYSIIDEQIPFYQMAIHGMVDYTGRPINLSADWQGELLRCAEYGAGLSFTFMQEDAKILQNSDHSGYYGASVDAWGDEAMRIIAAYQQDMEGLNQLKIVDHALISDHVTVTVYEDGTSVYVNDGSSDCMCDGLTVPARSYLVARRDQQ